MSRRPAFAVLTVALIAAGLIWRLAPLGLPYFFYKYGGSVIWSAMVYCAVVTLAPRLSPGRAAIAAAAIAVLSEFFRLYHTPGLDAFRATLFGALLLGRTFQVWNIVSYLVGIAVAWGIDDRRLERRKRTATS